MRFDIEPFVKLYTAESAEHRLMSIEARGFRDLLLRFASKAEDGLLLRKSINVPKDLCRFIGADSSDAKKVSRWINELVGVGYLKVSEGGSVRIVRFAEAQSARSPGAKRQAEYRERHRGSEDESHVTSHVTHNEASPVTRTVTRRVTSQVTSPKRREEKRREEKMETREPASPTAPTPSFGPETPITCPMELLPDHVVDTIAGHFQVDPTIIRDAEREFKSYWTIGGGMGRKFSRAMWISKCREKIRRRFEEGSLTSKPIQAASVSTGPAPVTPEAAAAKLAADEAFVARRARELGLDPNDALATPPRPGNQASAVAAIGAKLG